MPVEIKPRQHIRNLHHLVSLGEWDDALHRRFHQSNWYDWSCKTINGHIKYLEKKQVKRMLTANQTYAQLIQALVNHIKEAKSTYYGN